MERNEGLNRLPGAYADGLRLRESGLDDDAIALELALEPHALAPLLRLADEKLAALLHTPPEEQHEASTS